MAQGTIIKLNSEIRQKVLQFGRLLMSEGVPVKKLVIFGSYAKDKATKDSDIDLCVVSPSFGKDSIDEMQFLFKKSIKIDSRIEPYPVSPSDYDKVESPIILEIRKYGLEIF